MPDKPGHSISNKLTMKTLGASMRAMHRALKDDPDFPASLYLTPRNPLKWIEAGVLLYWDRLVGHSHA